MGFNINCRDCAYYRKGFYDDVNYCCHPHMIYYYGGEPPEIDDIEQNIDCQYFEKN